MAISVVGTAKRTGGYSSYTLSLPAGVQAGDLVIACAGAGKVGSAAPYAGITTSGYTTVISTSKSSNYSSSLAVARKIMGSTPDASVTFYGLQNYDGATCGLVVVLRGVDSSTPIDVTPASATGTQLVDAPAITPVTSGAVIFDVATIASDDSQYPDFGTPPSGYTLLDKIYQTGITANAALGCCSKSWSSGSDDPGTWPAGSLPTGVWCAATIAVRPAATTPQNGAVVGSGGMVFGGAAPASADIWGAVVGVGGMVFGGAAPAGIGVWGDIMGSGGMIFGGAAEMSSYTATDIIGSGGIIFGGSADMSSEAWADTIGSGGMVFGGAANVMYGMPTLTSSLVGSGGMVFGGAKTRIYMQTNADVYPGDVVSVYYPWARCLTLLTRI